MSIIIKVVNYTALKSFSVVGGGACGVGLPLIALLACQPFVDDRTLGALSMAVTLGVCPVTGIIGTSVGLAIA